MAIMAESLPLRAIQDVGMSSAAPGKTPSPATKALLTKWSKGVQDDMMVAMLSTLQMAANMCAQICIDRLGALHDEILSGQFDPEKGEADLEPGEFAADGEADAETEEWLSPDTFGVDPEEAEEEEADEVDEVVDSVTVQEHMSLSASVLAHMLSNDSSEDEAEMDPEDYFPEQATGGHENCLAIPEGTSHRSRHSPGMHRRSAGPHDTAHDGPTSTAIVRHQSATGDAYSSSHIKGARMQRQLLDNLVMDHFFRNSVVTAASDPWCREGPPPGRGECRSMALMIPPATELSPDELSQLLRVLASHASKPEFQDQLAYCRGSPSDWGPWLVASADSEDADTILQLRSTKRDELQWPPPVKALRVPDLLTLGAGRDEQLKNGDIQDLIVGFLRRRGCTNNVLSMLSFLDIIMREGLLDSIPVDQLEVAWAMRLFPSQVLTLVQQEGGSHYSNLQSLRKRVNELLKVVPKWDTSMDHITLISKALRYRDNGAIEPLVGLEQRSEESLIRIGMRAIELLNLQDIISPRTWKNSTFQRATLHKAVIVAGAVKAEALYQELKRTCAVTFARAAPCRLNENLHDMGFDLLPPDASLMLRSQAREHSNRCCLTVFGLKPLLATAPCNIFLAREGEPLKKLEEHTTHIAEKFATRIGGSSLTWSRREQYKSELRWAMAQRRGAANEPYNASGLFDPDNHDPGNLVAADIRGSEWYMKMATTRETFSAESVVHRFKASLHLDIHGTTKCPPEKPHLTIGLGAMVLNAAREDEHDRSPQEQILDFADALYDQVLMVIEGLRLQPEGEMLLVVIPPSPEAATKHSGAFPPSSGRHTLTQQSVGIAGFTHACHLEMSPQLRKALFQDRDALNRLADAFWDNFTRFTAASAHLLPARDRPLPLATSILEFHLSPG